MKIKEPFGIHTFTVWDKRGKFVGESVTPFSIFPRPIMTIGKVRRDGRVDVNFTKPIESRVVNWMHCLHTQVSQTTTAGVVDTGGTSRSMATTNTGTFLLEGGSVGVGTQGIVVGLGTNPVTLLDTKLQTPVVEGTGTDQLNYQATQFDIYSTVSNTTSFNVKRRIVNNSSAIVTIKEAGWYVSRGGFVFCVLRELIGTSGYDIAVGETIEVKMEVPTTLGTGFVGNFAKLQYIAQRSASISSGQSIVDITGSTITGFSHPTSEFSSTNGAGSATRGVIVGTGTTAVAIGNNAIQTIIAHGTSSGQLQYAIVQFDAVEATATYVRAGVKRTFTNGSAGTVTPTESAWYVNTQDNVTTDKGFLIARVVHAVPIGIPAAGTAQSKFQYGVH